MAVQEDNEYLKSLLGEELYVELKELQSKQANTDMCSIGKPFDGEIPILKGCHNTTLNKAQLEAERDKFIKDLEDKFIPKSNDEENKYKQASLNNCTNNMSSIIQELQNNIFNKFTEKDQSYQLYFLLSSLLSLECNFQIYKLIYPKEEITIYSPIVNEYTNVFISQKDNYWSKIKRLENYYKVDGIRDYKFHNLANSYYRQFIENKSYIDLQSGSLVGGSLIETYQSSLKLKEEEVEKNKSRLMDLINEKVENYYFSLGDVLKQVRNKVISNYESLKAFIQADPLLTTNIEEYINNHIQDLYNGIQDIHESYIDKNRKKLANVDDNEKKTLVKCTNVKDLKSTIFKINDQFQNDLMLYYEAIDMYDDENIKSQCIKNFSNLKCLDGANMSDAIKQAEELLKEMDNQDDKGNNIGEDGLPKDGGNKDYKENDKNIPKNTDEYDLLSPKYWIKYTTFLNLVSLLPMHWTIGLILPPAIKVPLPIVYVFLTVVYIPPILTVIWLTINGIVIMPVVLTINFGSGAADSTWLVLFRGANKSIKKDGGCEVAFTGGLQPQVVNKEKPSKTAIVDVMVELTKSLPMLVDDYPPFSRLSLTNPMYLLFLNSMCSAAKPMMGLP